MIVVDASAALAALLNAGPARQAFAADRLSVFYGDWQSFGAPPEAARLGAIDRLDSMEHGVLMHGVDRRAHDGVRPTRDELVTETAAFLPYWETQRRDH